MSCTPNFLEPTVSLSAIIPLVKEEPERARPLPGVGDVACVSHNVFPKSLTFLRPLGPILFQISSFSFIHTSLRDFSPNSYPL